MRKPDDFSETLLDLSLLSYRSLKPRAIFIKSIGHPRHSLAEKPGANDALTRLLSKALDQKLAGKITGRQFRRFRVRVLAAIKKLPPAGRRQDLIFS